LGREANRVRLRCVLGGLPGVVRGDWGPCTVSGLTLDSRRVQPGDLFAALPGRQLDGRDFVPAALRAGAAALLLGPGDTAPPGIPALAAEDPRGALAVASARLHGRPSLALDVFGVTGTNGKTTVAALLSHLLRACGRPCGHWTTNEVQSGARTFRPALTTPEAPDVQRFLAEVRAAGWSAAAMEVSSHAIAERRIAEVRFRAAAVTNVTADHLDFHGTVQAYRETKRRFLVSLPAEAACLVNADDPGAVAAAAGTAARVTTYGLGEGAALRASAVVCSSTGCRAQVHVPGVAAPLDLRVPLPGRHNLANALAGLGLALEAGVDPAQAAEAVASFLPPPRRLALRRIGAYSLIDDVAMNAAGFEAVCATVAGLGFAQVAAVLALRGRRGPEVNAEIAACLARWAPALGLDLLTVSLSRGALRRYVPDQQVQPDELEAFAGAAAAGGLAIEVHAELDEAIGSAMGRLGPGGALLLLGTFGMDEGTAIATRLLGGAPGAGYPAPALG